MSRGHRNSALLLHLRLGAVFGFAVADAAITTLSYLSESMCCMSLNNHSGALYNLLSTTRPSVLILVGS